MGGKWAEMNNFGRIWAENGSKMTKTGDFCQKKGVFGADAVGTATRTNTDQHGRARTDTDIWDAAFAAGKKGDGETFFGRSRALAGE